MKLTTEQLEALQAWQSVRGRAWKADVRLAWETGDYQHSRHASALQQLRNELGPRWLIAYRKGDDQVGWLVSVKAPPFPTERQMFNGFRTMWLVGDSAGTLLEAQHTKADARRYCQNNRITLIEDPK